MERRMVMGLGRGLLVLFLVAGSFGLAGADEVRPTPEDAKVLAIKAADLIATKGLDAAAAEFNREGEFKHGQVYVNVVDLAGIWKVYPPRPAGVGQNVLNVRDPDGKAIVQEIIALAQKEGEGWIDYRWINPETKKIEPKTSYLKRVPGQDLIAYVGVYK